MRAMQITRLVSLKEVDEPLVAADLPIPEPADGELLLKVRTCGVCHTELDEIEGRTPPPQLPVVPGHQVVGIVEAVGNDVDSTRLGERVGVGWIHHGDGSEKENVTDVFVATGRDVNGGYAEYMTVPASYAYPIPDVFTDIEAAPLLCAGAIGYRALALTNMQNGDRLGLTGFGGSAHQVLQLARHLYPGSEIYVFARDAAARQHALDLGATWAGNTNEHAPAQLDAIIDTTPAWTPVVEAVRNLAPGGRLVINAIRKEDGDKQQLLQLEYDDIWMEREIKTVANITGHDIRAFLSIAAEVPIRPRVEVYDLADANRALVALKRQPVKGAKVLHISG